MVEFDKIKLVIWDLDETFWQGTLSEGEVSIPDQNIRLIKELTDAGIVNSICSKNDKNTVMEQLRIEKIDDYFVFPSINWEPKGMRVYQQVQDMQLRFANVLFIDDNPTNREEVKFVCPGIMVEDPDFLSQMMSWISNVSKNDTQHNRLKQYKVLEVKHIEKKNFNSNRDFLMNSNVTVTISHDCLNQVERIHDLLLRANQLNFTKVRSSVETLRELFTGDKIETGYISVTDNFGDYGIVGFYAICKGELIHFTFSCRILGMGIEQYVYNLLGRPKLEIVGEVISDLSSEEIPEWINQKKKGTNQKKMEIKKLKKHMVLVKGPCDLFQIYPYIAQTELFDTEFSYTTNRGFGIESTGHTTHIVEALRLTERQKQTILDEVPFSDAGMYSDAIFKNHYKVVFLSILSDANLSVYRRKGTGERLAFLEYLHPITDPENWDGIISGKFDNRNIRFTRKMLSDFAEKYEWLGRNTPEQIVDNLTFIREHLDKDCMLVIMLGGELNYEKNTSEAYVDRHIVHKKINHAVREFAEKCDNVRLMDVNKYLVDQSSFYDHFNHYIKPVYYKLAEEMVDIVNECTGSKIRETSRLKMVQVRAKEIVAPVYYKIKKWW